MLYALVDEVGLGFSLEAAEAPEPPFAKCRYARAPMTAIRAMPTSTWKEGWRYEHSRTKTLRQTDAQTSTHANHYAGDGAAGEAAATAP